MCTWSRPLAHRPRRDLRWAALRRSLSLAVALAGLAAVSCVAGDELVIGAATSVRDTGLLDELVREFNEQDSDTGTVKPVAAGSGRLLELARRGEVDVIISHSPEAEAQLLAEDQAIDRQPFMRIPEKHRNRAFVRSGNMGRHIDRRQPDSRIHRCL